MIGSGWRFASASVIGTSHLKQATPVCQDFSYCDSDKAGEVLLAVAADGAGSCLRSSDGAKAACETVRDFFSDFLSGMRPLTEITQETAVQCVLACKARLTELATMEARTPREFACTLLTAILGPTSSAFFQIGDGAIVVDGMDCDPFNWIFWPDRGEYENTTVFVTQEEALDHLQFERIERPIRKIAVFTDGIQRLALDLRGHIPHAPFFTALFSRLSACSAGPAEQVTHDLRDFLGSERVNNRTDDDKSLIIAVRD
jgi:hypothetical protein